MVVVVGQKRKGEDFLAILLETKPANMAAVIAAAPLAGQRGLSESRSTDSLDATSKDTDGRYKETLPGYIEGSISMDGIMVHGEETQATVEEYFEEGKLLYYVRFDKGAQTAKITPVSIQTYDFEAPYDDMAAFSIELSVAGQPEDVPAS